MSVKLKVKNWNGENFEPTEVEAEILDIKVHGFTWFTHKSVSPGSDKWTISEYSTGARVCEADTIQGAIELLDNIAKEKGKREFQKEIKRLRERYGVINTELPQPTL